MNFTVAVKLAREVETLCVWAGDCDCVVSEQFLWTPCDVIWAEDGVLQLAGADPSILTLEIRYQRDQTYYGQAFGPTRNTLWAKVWTYGMGISTCLHVHISTYLGTNWLQSTVTYDHCRNAAMLYESTFHICPLELVPTRGHVTRPCACCVPSWRGWPASPRSLASH